MEQHEALLNTLVPGYKGGVPGFYQGCVCKVQQSIVGASIRNPELPSDPSSSSSSIPFARSKPSVQTPDPVCPSCKVSRVIHDTTTDIVCTICGEVLGNTVRDGPDLINYEGAQRQHHGDSVDERVSSLTSLQTRTDSTALTKTIQRGESSLDSATIRKDKQLLSMFRQIHGFGDQFRLQPAVVEAAKNNYRALREGSISIRWKPGHLICACFFIALDEHAFSLPSSVSNEERNEERRGEEPDEEEHNENHNQDQDKDRNEPLFMSSPENPVSSWDLNDIETFMHSVSEIHPEILPYLDQSMEMMNILSSVSSSSSSTPPPPGFRRTTSVGQKRKNSLTIPQQFYRSPSEWTKLHIDQPSELCLLGQAFQFRIQREFQKRLKSRPSFVGEHRHAVYRMIGQSLPQTV